MTTIKLKNGSGAPLAGDLVQGEPALDLTNKRLYTEDSGGTVIEVGTNPSTLTVDTDTLVVDAANNRVGIGTTSPQQMLHLSGSVPEIRYTDTTGNEYRAGNNNGKFRVYDQTAASDRLVIDSSGNVGIGTSSIGDVLDIGIDATSAQHGIGISNQAGITLANFTVNRVTGENQIGATRTSFFPTFYSNGAEAMRIDLNGNVGIGTSNATPSNGEGLCIGSGSTITRIDMRNATTGDATGDGTSLQLNGNNFTIENREAGYVAFSTSLTERMRIDSSGNVGIGTASPSFLIEAYGATNASTGWNAGGTVTGFAQANTSNGDFRFGTTTSHAVGFYTQSIERMRISSSGNVGIGETAPSRALDIKSANPLNINTTSNNHIHFQVNDVTTGQYASSSSLPHQLCDSTGSSPRLVVDASGNVGIGTSSPNASLHISQNPPVLALGSTGSSDPRLDFYDQGTTTVGASMFLDQSEDMLCLLRTASGNATDGIRIDSSGNVGIGTDDTGNAGLSVSKANGSNNVYARINGVATANEAGLQISDQNTLKWTMFKPGSSNDLAFFNHTGGSEAMRIDSSGNLLVFRTTPGTNAAKIDVQSASDQPFLEGYMPTTGVTRAAFVVRSNVGSTNTAHLVVRADGDVENTNNNYGSLSDERVKSNIVDASSQIDDIMAVQVRSYTLDLTGDTHIGVVAQELEEAGMSGLVQEDEEGMKSVKYSVLYIKAIKALQEAVTRIETLEAEVAALKGA